MIDKIYQQCDISTTFFKIDNLVKPDIILDKQIFPFECDNRQKISPVDNQGNWPACVCYSICSIAEAYFWKRNGFPCNFDALELYKRCKEVDGNPKAQGTQIDIGLECALKSGIFGKFDESSTLKQHIVMINKYDYEKDEDLINTIKSILFKYDFITAGFKITSDYYYCSSQSYFIEHYHSHKKCGNHCMTICGWNKKGFIIQNQWGTSFGAKGFCVLSYQAFVDSFVCGGYISNVFDNLN